MTNVRCSHITNDQKVLQYYPQNLLRRLSGRIPTGAYIHAHTTFLFRHPARSPHSWPSQGQPPTSTSAASQQASLTRHSYQASLLSARCVPCAATLNIRSAHPYAQFICTSYTGMLSSPCPPTFSSIKQPTDNSHLFHLPACLKTMTMNILTRACCVFSPPEITCHLLILYIGWGDLREIRFGGSKIQRKNQCKSSILESDQNLNKRESLVNTFTTFI